MMAMHTAVKVLKAINSTFRKTVLVTIRIQSSDWKKNWKFFSPTNLLPVMPFMALKSWKAITMPPMGR
ncbi:hypothetical protein D3C75_1381660 [compost metagenome]